MKDLEKQLKKVFTETDKSQWSSVKLGDIVREVKETCSDPESEGIERVVGLEHLIPLDIHIRDWKSISDGTTFTRVFRKGQVLFGRRRAYQRKAALAEFDGLCSGDIIVMEAIEDKLNPGLLPFIVHSDEFYEWAVSTSAGSLSPRTKFKHLAELEIRLPSVDIQEKISKLLWSVDELKNKTVRTISDLEDYKNSYLESKIFSQEGDKISLKDIGSVVRGVGYKPSDLGDEKSIDHYPILRSNNIQEGGLVFDDLNYVSKNRIKSEQLLIKDDVVICMSNGSKELVGKASVFHDYERPVSFGSFCAAFRPLDTQYGWLIGYIFKSHNYRKQISLLLTGSNINNLKPSDIDSISFKIRPNSDFSEEKKVLERIDEMEKKAFSNLDNVKKLGQSIINRL